MEEVNILLSNYTDGFSMRALVSGFLDVHHGIRSRCGYIRKRIIRYYGEGYWDKLCRNLWRLLHMSDDKHKYNTARDILNVIAIIQ